MFNGLLNDSDLPDLFDGVLFPSNVVSTDTDIMSVIPIEIKALNDRVERLEIALNTQTLRLELERSKRQKLALLLKNRKPEVPIPQLEVLQRAIDASQAYQDVINLQLGGNIDHLSTVMFRCISRIQQLFSFAFSCIQVTPSDQPDVSILLEEIGRTLQQLHVRYPTNTNT